MPAHSLVYNTVKISYISYILGQCNETTIPCCNNNSELNVTETLPTYSTCLSLQIASFLAQHRERKFVSITFYINYPTYVLFM